jgi:hypothetical protein
VWSTTTKLQYGLKWKASDLYIWKGIYRTCCVWGRTHILLPSKILKVVYVLSCLHYFLVGSVCLSQMKILSIVKSTDILELVTEMNVKNVLFWI